jgi:hypothetical protein
MVLAQELGEGRLARMFFIERVSVERGTRSSNGPMIMANFTF